MKYAFIQEERRRYPLTVLCRVLQVSRSGYYAFLHRAPAVLDTGTVGQVRRLHLASRRTYGQRGLRLALRAEGLCVGRWRTRTLMRQVGVSVEGTHPWKPPTTDSAHAWPIAPNRLNRQFTVSAPNRVWGSDLTCLPTQEGWLYLAVVVDLFSRKIVSWAMAGTLETALVVKVLRMAIGRRQPPPGLLHHSDRRSQYASVTYKALLRHHQMIGSMSRRGNCWDNAVVERVLRSVKHEGLDPTTKTQIIEATVIDYVEMFYNSQRLHTTLGYQSPNAFEARGQEGAPGRRRIEGG
ncbi:MAG: IS3 family transposase [Nitrospirales bacterium]|nr:IS3 family transposase [Nitrospirales bacterium]